MSISSADTKSNLLQRAYRRAFGLRALFRGGTQGALLAATLLLPTRAALPESTPRALFAIGAALVIAGGCVAVALRSRRRLPTRTQCRAMLDAQAHAGGLLLVADRPGAESWPEPEIRTPTLPRYVPGRFRWMLPTALLIVGAMLALPSEWLHKREPAPIAPGLKPLMEQTEEKIEDMLARDLLTPEEAEPLRSWLEKLSLPQHPGEALLEATAFNDNLLEALDHINASLDQKASDAATPMPTDLASSSNASPIAPQLDALSPSERRLLESLSALNPSDPRCSTGSCDNAQEALEQLLKEHEQMREQLRQSAQQCPGEGQMGNEEGAGNSPGMGTPARGPGDAPLTFGDPLAERDQPLRDSALKSAPRDAPLDETTVIGQSASAPRAADAPAAVQSGALTPAGTPSGASHVTPTLPRHRPAIQRFFSP